MSLAALRYFPARFARTTRSSVVSSPLVTSISGRSSVVACNKANRHFPVAAGTPSRATNIARCFTRGLASGGDEQNLSAQRTGQGFAGGANIMDMDGIVHVTGYDNNGFEVNEVAMHGGVLLFPDATFMWRPETIAEVTVESLSFLLLVKHRPDILVLGTGPTTVPPSPAVRAWCQKHYIALEFMDSRNAVSTYNFLAEERRVVALALLPRVPRAWD